MRKRNLFIVVTGLILAFPITGLTQTWDVPADQKEVVAPFKFTSGIQKQGEQLYAKNCHSCHGNPGKNDWAKLTPPPGDLSAVKAQRQTDGEWFYKITTGKAPMPEFRNVLSEDERWWVVAFLRSFNPGYIQPEPVAKKVFTGRIVTLGLAFDSTQKQVIVKAYDMLPDNQKVPAAGVEVELLIQRYFGNMTIGSPVTTNAQGIAKFTFPGDLPAQRDGFSELVARVLDPKGLMRTTPDTLRIAAGKSNNQPSLIETRAWWSVRLKAPVWIILTYTLSVLIVWGFIIYIVLLMVKFHKSGKLK